MGGGDKCLMPFGGSTLLGTALARLTPQTSHLAISANGDPARFDMFRLPVLADPLADFQGPLAGLLAGLQWAAGIGHTRALLSVAGDTPFLPDDLVRRLSETRGEGDAIAVAASQGRRHPVIALWPLSLLDDLRDYLATSDSRSVVAFQARHRAIEVPFALQPLGPKGVDPFFNVNTPTDLAEAGRLLVGGRA
jgi:molybdopterin-guanine dinucleotide biosynthesis protein A